MIDKTKQWHPAPADLTADLVKHQWTKDRPAPYLVAYLWVWHLLHYGSTVSIRDLSTYAGYSRWRARQIRDRVFRDMEGWKHRTQKNGQLPDTYQTATRHLPDSGASNDAGLEPETRHLPDSYQTLTRQSPDDHARSTYTNKSTSKSKDTNTANKPSVIEPLWTKIAKLRKEHIPAARTLQLTKARRKVLKARIMDSSAEEVSAVVTWWLTSTHKRARYLREEGYSIDTILRASKFAQYLEYASEIKIAPSTASHFAPAKEPKAFAPLSAYSDEEIAAANAELRAMGLRDMLKESELNKARLSLLADTRRGAMRVAT